MGRAARRPGAVYARAVPQLLLVRHGQASFGTDDYDRLSELGVRQAQLTGQTLRDAEVPIARVVSGSLRRQHDTAQAIADLCGQTVTTDDRWNEYDADTVLRHHSPSAVRLEHPGTPDAVPGSPRAFQAALEAALSDWIETGAGSDAAETFPGFADRVAAALSDAAAAGSGTTVVCSSGGSIAAVCAVLTGGGTPAFIPFNRVAVNCGLSRVIAGRSGTSLVSFNEQGHLPADAVTYR